MLSQTYKVIFSHVVAQILLKPFGTDIHVLRQQFYAAW